jgi:hypothetical protein
VQVASLLASSAVVGILVSVFGIAALPAFTATALVIGVSSYLVHRTWTFSTRVQGETG